MKNKILLLIVLSCMNCQIAFSSNQEGKHQPKIVTSITPLIGIISMVTGDKANLVAIDSASGCPHHYNLKLSDRDKLIGADVMVYIDDHFDNFAGRLISDFKGRIIKVSDIKSTKFIGENGKNNWHIWLDLGNVIAIQEEVSAVLSKEFPELAENIASNQIKAKEKLDELAKMKEEAMEASKNLVVLSDSLEHFFAAKNSDKVTKLYQKTHASLSDFENLDKLLNNDSDLCIVLDSTQNRESYKKYNKNIIQIDSENWNLDPVIYQDNSLFYDKYVDMINQLKSCRKSID